MQIEEAIKITKDNLDRLQHNEFTGTARIEVHCHKGGLRRIVVIEEPEKREYVGYDKKNT